MIQASRIWVLTAIFLLSPSSSSSFAADELSVPDDAGLSRIDPQCITVNKLAGRAHLSGARDAALYPDLLIGHLPPFLAEMHFGGDPEALYAEHRPLGMHYISGNIPEPEFTDDQRREVVTAIEHMKASTQSKAWMPNRIVASLVGTEGKFLRENAKRVEGLRDALFNLERQHKKPDRQQAYRDEIELLIRQAPQIEESILGKFNDFAVSPTSHNQGLPDIASDINLLANAAYEAAIHRAKRFNIPFRETRTFNGDRAIEFLEHDGTDIGKLVRTVRKMTDKEPQPYRVIFSPAAILKHRETSSTMYMDARGDFGVTPQYLLAGQKDRLFTPMQLRALQLVILQNKGTPTPFRGQVTQDASTVDAPHWVPLYQGVLKGTFIRNFSKAIEDQSPKQKVEMVSALHDMLGDTNLFMFLSGAGLAQRFASRGIEKLIHGARSGIKAQYGQGFFYVAIPHDTSPEKLTGQIVLMMEPDGHQQLILHSPYARFKMPLNGKDLRGAMSSLNPLITGKTTSDVELTRVQRDNLVRVLRVAQRTLDVASNLSAHMDEQSEAIKKAAKAYVETPGEESEAKLHEAIAAYREPKLDRLSLRGIGEAQPKDSVDPTPEGADGPDTPEHLVNAFKTALGLGKNTAAYRAAVEQIGTYAVRAAFEKAHLDTLDRGPDLMGYDVSATSREAHGKVYVEIKATSDPNGFLTFTPAEIQFARNHLDARDWALAIVIVDAEGKTKLHFRRGMDLGPPLPPNVDRRPLLIHDILTMGSEVPASEVKELLGIE